MGYFYLSGLNQGKMIHNSTENKLKQIPKVLLNAGKREGLEDKTKLQPRNPLGAWNPLLKNSVVLNLTETTLFSHFT